MEYQDQLRKMTDEELVNELKIMLNCDKDGYYRKSSDLIMEFGDRGQLEIYHKIYKQIFNERFGGWK